MSKENLELWNRVEKTDPKHTKKANVGGNKITSISPQYQILNATREFGAYGEGWGFRKLDFDYSLSEKFNLVILKAEFFHPKGVFPIMSSIKLYKDNALTKIDDDFAKKLETDALTKALSKMGFNADIFMGRYDDVKYVNEMKEEFKSVTEPLPLSDDRFKAALLKLKEGKTTVEAIKKFKLTASQLDLIK